MSTTGPPLTLGTSGHIDHGKTALIGALTGHDTDRLPEERERGLSIELGYAPLELPSGRRLSVVDVPGHERFVRTMVAGASGIDLFLLCVAADDGVMPQTREHLTVLRGLGVRPGVVAITKADAGESQAVAAEVEDLIPGSRRSRCRRYGAPASMSCSRRSTAWPGSSPAAPPMRTVRRGSTSTARSRSGGSAPWSQGRFGRASSPQAI
jgi:Elongation factor Tu GTP binding domain